MTATSRARVARGVPLADALLAAVLVGAAVLSSASDHAAPHPWTEVIVAGWMASVALRRVSATAMVILASAGAAGYALLPSAPVTPLWCLVALLVVSFSLGAADVGRSTPALVGLLLVSTEFLSVESASRQPDAENPWVSALLVIGAPLLAGLVLRRARSQSAELRQLTESLAEEREANARAVALEERNRVARELHDVITRAVGAIVVEAEATERSLPIDSAARAALGVVCETGRRTIAELHEQLGVLATGDETRSGSMPQLTDLHRLTDQEGVRLEYDAVTVGETSAGLGLAVYRLVQEALTNARKHARDAPVSVRLTRSGNALEVEVRNGPGRSLADAPGSGQGLTGMQERVAMYDGSLDVGPTPEGGWRVHASLPLPPSQAETLQEMTR